ncbi:enoyl-CoA hydratase/isomerase family protein [Conexibacter sp. S30A1]|uniref:enoyl-CoA hydratase/isomerase family protein n=1 Tax=Conexibacter sp. S30A1 TaxID=2937800 RepID=UPI00200DA8EF|nr:enoyl-CoA hydratase-related protein [Conexibacter sp. S30A1]
MVGRTESELVLFSVADHIATIAFNRPEVLNAVSTPVFGRLIEVFDQISDDPDVWCVILRGNGRAFCVGADQKERPGMSLDDVRRRRRISPQAFSAMRNCPRPVIAQVHGFALGGGLEMALGCDIVVAANDTVMGLIETRRGSIPAGGGTQLMPRLIGPAKAKELIFTGRKFTAAEAADWGLITYAVEPDALEAKVNALAQEIVASAPISNVQAKRAINASMDMDVANGIQLEAALYERILTTWDRTEALTAYKEKRAPQFRGE